MGGQNNDDNGNRQIMAQRYIPEIRSGDKRILLVDGKPAPYALARIRFRGRATLFAHRRPLFGVLFQRLLVRLRLFAAVFHRRLEPFDRGAEI